MTIFIVLAGTTIMSQAIFWNLFAKKMNGEATAAELHELESLLRQHPELVHPAEQVEKLWTPGDACDTYESELAFELHVNRLKEKGISIPGFETVFSDEIEPVMPRKTSAVRWAVSACIVLGLIVAVWLWPSTSRQNTVADNSGEISTRPGSKTKLVLPDSTVVWLNAGSKLSYSKNFGVDNRNTTLTGEAFFDVRKDQLPFTIHANGINVKVLGTAFNVKAYPDEKTTETSLVRGRVEITLDKRPGDKWVLKPNEKLVVANESALPESVQENRPAKVVLRELTHVNDSTIAETSWIDNKLVFQAERLAEIAQKMERWYGVRIRIEDENLAAQRLSGTFTTETVLDALDALQLSTKFHYSKNGDLITITP